MNVVEMTRVESRARSAQLDYFGTKLVSIINR